MITFKQFIKESEINLHLPPEPGTAPLPEGHVRLYHQTSPENLKKIEKEGIKFDKARGIEGPKGIWATEPYESSRGGKGSGFYGHPKDTPTAEFSVSKEEWEKHSPALQRDIKPSEILAIHHPWHSTVRYIARNGLIDKVKNGEFDHLMDEPKYAEAIKHVKEKL